MSKSKMPLLGWRIELCMHCAVWVVFWLIEEYTALIQHGSVNSYLSDMLQIEKFVWTSWTGSFLIGRRIVHCNIELEKLFKESIVLIIRFYCSNFKAYLIW